jgi:hypothetical protein
VSGPGREVGNAFEFVGHKDMGSDYSFLHFNQAKIGYQGPSLS